MGPVQNIDLRVAGWRPKLKACHRLLTWRRKPVVVGQGVCAGMRVARSTRIAIATTVLVVEAHRPEQRQVGFLFGAVIQQQGRSCGAIRSSGSLRSKARSPSGKARVCKTLIGGSIPPRASNFFILPVSSWQEDVLPVRMTALVE